MHTFEYWEKAVTTLIRIGNSQGIRIPKAIIEQAGLSDHELEFTILDDGLLIKPSKIVRQGWKEQFDGAAERPNDLDQEWLDADLTEDKEWEW